MPSNAHRTAAPDPRTPIAPATRAEPQVIAPAAVPLNSPLVSQPDSIIGLQRSIGNQSVQRMIQRTNNGARTINYDRYDQAISYMYDEMRNNAAGRTTRMIRQLIESAAEPQYDPYGGGGGGGYLAALGMWAGKVHSGGDWDHKPKLRDRLGLAGPPADYYFPLRGDTDNEYFYDIWSNIHYGYVGAAAGFGSGILQGGASLNDWFVGVNDDGDVLTVQMGIDLWNAHGAGLTSGHLIQSILGRRGELEAHRKAIPGRNFR